MKKILGMGNALTDILLQVDNDEILFSLNLLKGGMQLINTERSHEINVAVSNYSKIMATGGSASNTINGITRLGMQGGFVGKIGKDDIGLFFTNDSINNGVVPHLLTSETPSGRCTVLVTPDSERTLCTYLGAACELAASDLKPEMFRGYDIFHIEGYLVQNHDLIRTAVRLAKQEGLKVSVDLASYNVVEENLDFLLEIVHQYVDIVFANEEEAKSFTGMPPEDALENLARRCDIAVVKVGKEGAFVQRGDQKWQIPAFETTVIDTTGAGDYFAAGFLAGLASGCSLGKCGVIGSIMAAEVIQVVGAELDDSRWSKIKKLAELI